MAHLRKAKNYIVSFLAILVSGALSWLGFQPPAWANRPVQNVKSETAPQEAPVKKARKTAKAPSRKTVARRAAPKSSARVKRAA